jgi:small subunit ribosomal protein S20
MKISLTDREFIRTFHKSWKRNFTEGKMAQHKSAVKRIRSSARRRVLNRKYTSLMKTAIKRVRAATTKEKGQAALLQAVSVLDSLAAKGIIHRNKAANQKSKLTRFVNKLQ